MSIIRWLHISDLHLNTNETESIRMRRKLPQYILDNNIEYDYVFCTGDIRDSSAEHWREPFPSADFLKNLCEIRNISLDNLFIVPGNHDVNRTASDRENVVENMLWRDNKSWSRNYKTELGNIGDSTLQALHDGEKEFRSFLGKIYDRDKLQLYDDYLKPHFVVETEHFNILHIDSTLAYSEKQNRDLIIGSRQLQLALDDLNDSKPTIVLSHYAITSLDPEERRMVSNMLDDYHIYLWLAGHEHYHDLKPCGYIHSIQCGELKIEDRCKSTFLVGEYDTETGQVDIRAYNWFSPEGWAEYPILWRNSKTYTLRLSTKCNDGQMWSNTAKLVSDDAKGKANDIKYNQIFNLISSYQCEDADYTCLDLTNVRLPKLPNGDISLRNSDISDYSIGCEKDRIPYYNILIFSDDNDWLVGFQNSIMTIWNVETGNSVGEWRLSAQPYSVSFENNFLYLKIKSRQHDEIIAFELNDNVWIVNTENKPDKSSIRFNRVDKSGKAVSRDKELMAGSAPDGLTRICYKGGQIKHIPQK